LINDAGTHSSHTIGSYGPSSLGSLGQAPHKHGGTVTAGVQWNGAFLVVRLSIVSGSYHTRLARLR